MPYEPCAQELLNLMGYYQYAHLAASGQPFPLWTADLPATAERSAAGNATWLGPRCTNAHDLTEWSVKSAYLQLRVVFALVSYDQSHVCRS